ncbi:MAG: hypothetical protein ACK57G_08465 [Planctomycetota bacterium]|jgi:hypothetical protein
MRVARSITVAFLYLLCCDLAFAQVDGCQPAKAKSEDQWVAEAMWSLVDLGSGRPGNPLTAFDEAVQAHPHSSKIAYWRGRFRLFASGQRAFLGKFAEIADELSKPDPAEAALADQNTRQKLSEAREFSKDFSKRVEDRLKELHSDDANMDFEVIFQKLVSSDPTMIIAWAILLESADPVIALTAADAWAEQEPDNALPLYAKAIVLQRQRGQKEPIDPSAIEALEIGNSRPACRAPDEPWPEEFDLRFPNSLPAEKAELRGKPVGQAQLRTYVLGLFFTSQLFDRFATSGFAICDLGGEILGKSHRLSLEEDIRYLQAFAGVGTHLIHSNRLLYGMTAGEVGRILNRMETIAIDQEDFNHAIEIANLRDHVFTLKRKCSEGYGTVSEKEDEQLFDRVATQIMADNRKDLPIPTIEISKKPRPKWRISETRDDANDMVLLDLFHSNSHPEFVRGHNQAMPTQPLDPDELSRQGYRTLDEAIKNIRSTNFKEQSRRGIVVVLHSPYSMPSVFTACYLNGYMGRRDPCIIVFHSPKTLEFFQRKYTSLGLHLAQLLPPGDVLDQNTLDAVSKSADIVLVPYSRIMTADGQISPIAVASGKKFIIAGTKAELLRAENAVRENACLVGSMESDFVSQVARSE